LPDPSTPTLRERLSSTERSPLPDVTLDGFGGGPPVELAAYRGSPLVVNLWATWCAPCVEEMPAFDEVARGSGDRVAFLGVDVQDTPRAAEAFVRDLGIGYDLAADPRREFASAIGAFGMPTTLLVDGGGTIVYRHTGPLDAAELRRLLGEHLAVAL
jgi:cytochrome c biogenesis protein CcmG/thiol:disulfide interchange protein DsbE